MGLSLLALRAFATAATAASVASGCMSAAQPPPPDYKDAEYVIDGRRIKLDGGVAETEAAPGSAAKIITRYFGNKVELDIDRDGRNDVVFLLTHEPGGSGVFFYVVAALQRDAGWVGSHGLLLGDRIAPQTTVVGENNVVTVNYADRAPGQSFATRPSLGKSIWLLLDPVTLQFGEVAQSFEGEADPARMRLDMAVWKWIGTRHGDGSTSAPRSANVFTLTLAADGTFSATTDCNRLRGSYTTAGARLTFGDVAATRMYCADSQESEFTAMLAAVTEYRFTSRGQLLLTLDADGGTAEFR
jgi:heat shock protein HslJ